MKFGGIQKLSLLDFPGQSACVLFTVGCNFRCGYCHNPELVFGEVGGDADGFIKESEILDFLNSRVGLLDGVSISGGEPTLHSGLIEFIRDVKSMGFKLKLDTNGSRPDVVERLFKEELLDYIAMDVKVSPSEYAKVVGRGLDIELLIKSRDLIMSSGVEYEFRTTVLPALHDTNEFNAILEFVEGAERFYIQNFRNEGGCLDAGFDKHEGFTKDSLQKMKKVAEGYVDFVGVRV